MNPGEQASEGVLGLARRVRRLGLELHDAPDRPVGPVMGGLQFLELPPLVNILLRNLEAFQFLHLRGDDLGLVLERKAVLPRQFLKFLVEIIAVLRQIGEALFFLFLRLPELEIALESGFDLPLVLELRGLLGADALLSGVLGGLLVDLLERRFVFGGNFGLIAREEIALRRGELSTQGRDGRFGLAKLGVVGVKVALGLFETAVFLLAFLKYTGNFAVGVFEQTIEDLRLTVALFVRQKQGPQRGKLVFVFLFLRAKGFQTTAVRLGEGVLVFFDCSLRRRVALFLPVRFLSVRRNF